MHSVQRNKFAKERRNPDSCHYIPAAKYVSGLPTALDLTSHFGLPESYAPQHRVPVTSQLQVSAFIPIHEWQSRAANYLDECNSNTVEFIGE
jgi:hypothetical protein